MGDGIQHAGAHAPGPLAEPVDADAARIRFQEDGAAHDPELHYRPLTVDPDTLKQEILELIRVIRPQLLDDGMFLVGLDIIGGRLVEINVFSAGGLGSAQLVNGVDFAPAIVEALEDKVAAR